MPEQENNNLESIIKIAQSTIGLMSPLAKEISKHLIKRLVRRPFTLRQNDLKHFYNQINLLHYITIYPYIFRGMCYGYTILWLASMRAIHERKLLDQTDYSPEQVCFFKVIQILEKYENEDTNTMPDDTKQYFNTSLKYLETSFNMIKDIQEKQSPDNFFEQNNKINHVAISLGGSKIIHCSGYVKEESFDLDGLIDNNSNINFYASMSVSGLRG